MAQVSAERELQVAEGLFKEGIVISILFEFMEFTETQLYEVAHILNQISTQLWTVVVG